MEVRAQDPVGNRRVHFMSWALLRDVCKGVIDIHNFGSPLKKRGHVDEPEPGKCGLVGP